MWQITPACFTSCTFEFEHLGKGKEAWTACISWAHIFFVIFLGSFSLDSVVHVWRSHCPWVRRLNSLCRELSKFAVICICVRGFSGVVSPSLFQHVSSPFLFVVSVAFESWDTRTHYERTPFNIFSWRKLTCLKSRAFLMAITWCRLSCASRSLQLPLMSRCFCPRLRYESWLWIESCFVTVEESLEIASWKDAFERC